MKDKEGGEMKLTDSSDLINLVHYKHREKDL